MIMRLPFAILMRSVTVHSLITRMISFRGLATRTLASLERWCERSMTLPVPSLSVWVSSIEIKDRTQMSFEPFRCRRLFVKASRSDDISGTDRCVIRGPSLLLLHSSTITGSYAEHLCEMRALKFWR